MTTTHDLRSTPARSGLLPMRGTGVESERVAYRSDRRNGAVRFRIVGILRS